MIEVVFQYNKLFQSLICWQKNRRRWDMTWTAILKYRFSVLCTTDWYQLFENDNINKLVNFGHFFQLVGERERGEGVKQGETGEHRDGEALQILFDSQFERCMHGRLELWNI